MVPSRIERLLGAPAGQEVTVGLDLVVTDDWTTPALLPVLAALGTRRAAVPVVLVRDHTQAAERYLGADREKVLTLRRAEQRFLELTGARLVAGEGIQHHVLPALGLLQPGMVVLGNDSHTPTLGAHGVAAFAGQPTTIAAAIHKGSMTLRVPASIRVRVAGALRSGVTVRDAAFTLLAILRGDSPYPRLATGKVLEFCGPGLVGLSVAELAVLANVAPEAVAVTATFDLAGHGSRPGPHGRSPDPAARTAERAAAGRVGPPADVELDLDQVVPVVARSGSTSDVVAREELPRLRVDRVFVGTCAGGTYAEIIQFAQAIDGPVAVPAMVTPVSRAVFDALASAGTIARLERAGVTVTTPGCGACFGFGWRLADGEVAVTTGNRNGVGRMGSARAQIYLVSGVTAAEAARTGALSAGSTAARSPGAGSTAAGSTRAAPTPRRPTIQWPTSGNVVRVRGMVTTDDLTPSSVPGIGTSSDADPEVSRRLLFHHLDPSAASRDLRRSIIVADENFGTGSNRASAVRALKAAGVAAVIARSVAPLYARGAQDEGLPVWTIDDDRFFELATPEASIIVEPAAGTVSIGGVEFFLAPETAYERAVREAGGLIGALAGDARPPGPNVQSSSSIDQRK